MSAPPQRAETCAHGRTGEFPEGIPPYPPCRGILRIRQAPRHQDGGSIEGAIALADRAEGHVRGFLDEMALVTGFAFDQGKPPLELFIARPFVVHGETPQQREGRALLKLVAPGAPLGDLGPRVRGAIEKVEAHRIAECPVIEVFTPSIHLSGCELLGIADEGCEHSGLVHARGPEGHSEWLAAPERLAEGLDVLHRNAVGVVRGDRKRAIPSRVALVLRRFSQASAN